MGGRNCRKLSRSQAGAGRAEVRLAGKRWRRGRRRRNESRERKSHDRLQTRAGGREENTGAAIPGYVTPIFISAWRGIRARDNDMLTAWQTECSAKRNRGVNEAFTEAARVALSVKGAGTSSGGSKCEIM